MSEITVGRYLFERLKQLGIKSIFGVPGDYELALLDFIPEAGLTWRGNPNELNAGYAADGYGRINGAGAVVTTFGPGELSNMCPIAGAYTEFVPIAHIVGYPTESAQNGTNIMHHSLGEVGDGKFDVFHKMSEHITAATTVIHNEGMAAKEIDRCLNAMMYYSQPVYIGLPTDIALKKISPTQLETPLITTLPKNDSTLQTKVVSRILEMVDTASNPIIIVDGGATRNKILPEATKLIELTGLPYFVTTMGKGSVSEHLNSYGGVYCGVASNPEVKKAVESSDCILWLGNYPSDLNTGEFTEAINAECVIDFQRFYIKVGRYTRYDVKMKYVLEELLEVLPKKPLSKKLEVSWNPYPENHITKLPHLTQDYLWPTLGRFFRNGDLVVVETGTSAYGIPTASLKHLNAMHMYTQTVFGSIGFATGSAVGAFVAGKELGLFKRNILITGEGSLQLTVQAFADLIRHEVNLIVFLINNDGYTIERLIHGMEAEYNTIPAWDYRTLFGAFGPKYETKHFLVQTPDALEALLRDPQFNGAACATIVELILGKHDAPKSIITVAAAVEEFNHRVGR